MGRPRLLLVLALITATALALAFGMPRAFAVINQGTTTTFSITDTSTGQPVSGTIGTTEQVTITVTVTGTTAAPVGTFSLPFTKTNPDGSTTTGTLIGPGGATSWPLRATGAITSTGSVSMVLGEQGTYDVDAQYTESRGAGFSNSSSAQTPVTVAPFVFHNTATGLTATPSTITSGQQSTLTATVVSLDGGPTPSGNVQFYSLQAGQKTAIGSPVALDASGTASITRSDWSTGTLPLEADYLGTKFVDATGNVVQFNPSAGNVSLTVNPATDPTVTTTTTVTAIPMILRSDQIVHVSVHVQQTGTSTASIVSSVVFRAEQVGSNGSVPLGTATLDANGNASIDVGGWSPGNYIITADYFGNIDFQASTGQTTILTVNPVVPSVTTYLHDTQTYVGDTATLAAKVVDGNTGAPVPAGEPVTLTAGDGNGTNCTGVTTSNGIASCTVVFPAPGTFSVLATYPGDTVYDPSSGPGQITVLQVPTNTTVSASPNPTPTRASVTLTAHLTDAGNHPAFGSPIAGRYLTLTLNSNETCDAGPTDANGNASCSIPSVSETPGTYQVTATFAGDGPTGEYLGSSGNNTLTVTAALPTNWTYTGTTSVYAGQPATLQFVLRDGTGQLMPNRNVTLSLNGTNYDVTTDANGVATQPITAPATAGTYTPTAHYGGEPGYFASDGTGTLVVNTIPTTLTYTGTTSVYGGQQATISFVLTDVNNNPVRGMTVTETLPGGGSYTGTTDATGAISTTITAPTPATDTTYTPTASFGGSLPYLASNGTGSLAVHVVPTNITYDGDTSVNAGASATISFVLRDSTTNAVLPNMPVAITLPDGTTYSTTTDANGYAYKVVTAPLSAGSYPVKESFAGKNQYLASTGNGTLVVTTIPTSVTYVGDTSVYQGATATLAAKLVDVGGNVLPNEKLTLTLATGETCSGITNALGVASCQVVVNEATTLPGQPYNVAISFGGDLPYLPSTGNGALAVVAAYAAPAAGWCTSGLHKCESMIANPTVVSPTQLQVLYTDDSVLPNSASLAPTAVLDGGQQLVVTVTPTSGQVPSYTDTWGGSTATRNQDFVNIAVPSGLSAGNHTIRVFINDGDGDWDQWTWTINVGANGSVGTVSPGPGPVTCGVNKVKCESILADPSVLSNSQLSIVAMDDSAIPMAGSQAPSATLNGQALPVSVSTTSGQPQNYVDKTGGSLSTKYQVLIRIDLPSGLAAGNYTVLVTAYDGDGDLDQWGWPISVSSDGTVTSNASSGGTGSAASMIAQSSSITANFSNAISAGNTVWLTNSAKVTGLPPAGATITFTNQSVTIGTTTISLPDAEISYSPTATSATTTWDAVNGEWNTVVPKNLGGNIFATGLGYVAPADIGKASVTWSATVSSDTPGVTVAWQWAAAEYTGFNTDPSLLGVKPCDDKNGSSYTSPDHAGTPENYKTLVVAGGTGGGGPNYTGNNTPSTSIKF